MTASDAISSSFLRLSAVRAFLGKIDQSVRLIKCSMHAEAAVITCIADESATSETRELFDIACSEIAADLPAAMTIEEHFIISDTEIPNECTVRYGWIYLRHEESL